MRLVQGGVRAPRVETRDVSVRRCGRSFVQRVSICATEGEVLALCGAEGSGSATLLQVMAGTLAPDLGRVLVDGRVVAEGDSDGRLVPRAPARPDPRCLATGPAAAASLLDSDASVLLLDRPLDGLDAAASAALARRCRAHAEAGATVVVTSARPDPWIDHATTLALFVAGRLLSWGPPAVALVPALQLLSAGARVHPGGGAGVPVDAFARPS